MDSIATAPILPEIRSTRFPMDSKQDFDRQAFERTGSLRRIRVFFLTAIRPSISCSLANHPPRENRACVGSSSGWFSIRRYAFVRRLTNRGRACILGSAT